MKLFKELHKDGVTIIQVTHSEKNARYGTRIIEIEDGFVRKDIPVTPSKNPVSADPDTPA